MSDGPVIEVVDVVKQFDRETRALDGVSLEVGAGELVAIAGPSGSGKSTLLHLLAALDAPTSGHLVVGGRELEQRRGIDHFRRWEVGLVFQFHNLLPHLDARQNVEMAMYGTGKRRWERRRRADELLEVVALASRRTSRPTELSGGERQRVAVARAFANDPRVLLADEPTGSLDPEMAGIVIELLRQRCVEAGGTVLAVSHDVNLQRAADRVVYLVGGRIAG